MRTPRASRLVDHVEREHYGPAHLDGQRGELPAGGAALAAGAAAATALQQRDPVAALAALAGGGDAVFILEQLPPPAAAGTDDLSKKKRKKVRRAAREMRLTLQQQAGDAGARADMQDGIASLLPAGRTEQFLLGAAIGAVAAYVLSDEELRGRLMKGASACIRA